MFLLRSNRLRTQLSCIVFQVLFHTLHHFSLILSDSAGPGQNTLSDMWRMVWQLNVNRIVMVTQLSENGKVILASVIYCSLCKQTMIFDLIYFYLDICATEDLFVVPLQPGHHDDDLYHHYHHIQMFTALLACASWKQPYPDDILDKLLLCCAIGIHKAPHFV